MPDQPYSLTTYIHSKLPSLNRWCDIKGERGRIPVRNRAKAIQPSSSWSPQLKETPPLPPIGSGPELKIT